MTRKAIIEKTIKAINQLPDDKAEKISNFAEFVFKKYEENQLSKGIQNLIAENPSFYFLNDEDDLYSAKDLKQVYND